jgi:two-component SAPR family response regulator
LDRQENSPVFLAVVDDEVDLAYLFRDALSQIPGVRVFAFSDPVLALEHFQHNQENYRLIISDYRMPELNGVQLLNMVKQVNKSVKTILISAFEVQDQMFDCNCIDKLLQKPIPLANLVAEVQRHIIEVEIQKQEG